MMDNTSLAFNGRYLVISILTYILSAHIALSVYPLSAINTNLFSVYNISFLFIISSASSAVLYYLRKNRELFSLCIYCIAFIFIFVAGYSHTCKYIYMLDTQKEIISAHPRIYGTVKSEPALSNSGKTLCVTVDVHIASDKSTSIPLDDRCLVTVYYPADSDTETLGFGSTVSFEYSTGFDSQAAYTDAFDYIRYLRQDGVCYVGYSALLKEYSFLEPKSPLIHHLENTGLKIRNFILASTSLLAYGSKERTLLEGILVGKTENFSDLHYKSFTDSGFVHIASVSGMHTSYLFMAISALLTLIKTPRRIISLITIPILMLFTSVALFTPSVCRAVIMMIILLAASIFRRSSDGITSLSVAALILVFQNPYCLESYGFLLSFGATLGILIYLAPIQNFLRFAVMKKPSSNQAKIKRTLYRLNKFSQDSVCLSISATIGIAYFTASFFGKIQWGGILGNILIFPLAAISFVGGYINSAICSVSNQAAELVAKLLINPSLWCINRLSDFFALRFFRFEVPPPSKSFFIVYIFICVCLYYLITPAPYKTTENLNSKNVKKNF